jgi:RNA polymerase sigma factor (sigma-70 family)
MASTQAQTVLRRIRRWAETPGASQLEDLDLLDRFAARRDEAAFEALIQRYGPLVLGVCRRVLHHTQDAEDAFQATFLVLARKADSIRRRESLGGWLYRVAYHLALKAKAAARRRRGHEQRRAGRAGGDPAAERDWHELRAVLDEELRQVPPRCRLALVTCYLEGRTQDEAARKLGWSKATLRRRLDEGRELLRLRLVRRGFTLSGALFATLLGEGSASATVPGTLATAILQAATAGVVPAKVAVLVEGGLHAMASKWKIAMALFLMAGLVTGGVLTHHALSARPSPTPTQPSTKTPAEKPRQFPTPGAVTIHGQVLDPDGKPLAGAKLSLVTPAVKKKADLAVRATSGKDGRFHFSAARADTDRGTLLAQAKGYGPDWVELKTLPRDADVKLRLAVDDVPISGRVLDLEGRPIAGVTARVLRVGQVPGDADLKPWLDKNIEMRRTKGTYLNENGLTVVRADLLDVPTTATTGDDGRFRLTGFGRDRVLRLNIEGPTIAWRKGWAVTRPGPARGFIAGRDVWDVFAARLEYIAGPCKPIVGTVREKGTGKPLAGITVGSAMHGDIETTTDKDGRYRIVGAAKKPSYAIVAEGEQYFNCTKMNIADTQGVEPISVDFELERGIVIRGRLTNKVTGEPVRGSVFYCALADNPNLKNFKEVGSIGHVHLRNISDTAADGSFTALGIPGPGLLVVRANDGAFVEAKTVDAKGAAFQTVPNIVLTGHHALVPVNISEKDPKSHIYDIALDPGRSVQGVVVGPDSQPLTGTRIQGLTSTRTESEEKARKDAAFMVTGLEPSGERTLIFYHEQKKLGKMLRMRGDEKGPLTVQLEPLVVLTGRMIDAAGHPLARLTVRVRQANPAFDLKTTTDKDGKFRIEGLLPRTKFLLAIAYGDPWERRSIRVYVEEDLSVESGKTKDLGDLKPKPPRRK